MSVAVLAFIAVKVELVPRKRYPKQTDTSMVRVMFVEELASDRVRCGGRRLHVGGRLMQAAMLYAIEQQCEEVHLVVQNGDAQRRAVVLYNEWWICKDSGKRGRVRGADGEQVSFASARPGMEYRIGPVGLGTAMVAVAGMTTRRYYTLDSAPGTVRGQVRAMFEAAHVSAQDGHTWEAHSRDAMHILLGRRRRVIIIITITITIITLARRLAQRRAACGGARGARRLVGTHVRRTGGGCVGAQPAASRGGVAPAEGGWMRDRTLVTCRV